MSQDYWWVRADTGGALGDRAQRFDSLALAEAVAESWRRFYANVTVQPEPYVGVRPTAWERLLIAVEQDEPQT